MIDLKKDIEIGICYDPDDTWEWEDLKEYTMVSVRVLLTADLYSAIIMAKRPGGESLFFNINGELLGCFGALNNPYHPEFVYGKDNTAKLRNKEATSEGI